MDHNKVKPKLSAYLIDVHFIINSEHNSLSGPITETIIKYRTTIDKDSIFIAGSSHINDLEVKNNFIRNVSVLHYRVLADISEFDNLRISLINLLKKYNYIYGINLYHDELPVSLDNIEGVHQEIYPSRSHNKGCTYSKFTDGYKNHISLSSQDVFDAEDFECVCRKNNLIMLDPHRELNIIPPKKNTDIVLYSRLERKGAEFSPSHMINKIKDVLNSHELNTNNNSYIITLGTKEYGIEFIPIYITIKQPSIYLEDFYNTLLGELYDIDQLIIGITINNVNYSDFLIDDNATDIEKDVITGVFAKLA